MTREECIERTKKCIEVMQAYISGDKPIQWKIKKTDERWYDVDKDLCIIWDWSHDDYRIKPEPTYQPYDVKTLTEAIAKHGYAVKTKDDNSYYQILKWKNSEVVVYNYSYTYKKFLEKFIWADDDSPCGAVKNNEGYILYN